MRLACNYPQTRNAQDGTLKNFNPTQRRHPGIETRKDVYAPPKPPAIAPPAALAAELRRRNGLLSAALGMHGGFILSLMPGEGEGARLGVFSRPRPRGVAPTPPGPGLGERGCADGEGARLPAGPTDGLRWHTGDAATCWGEGDGHLGIAGRCPTAGLRCAAGAATAACCCG